MNAAERDDDEGEIACMGLRELHGVRDADVQFAAGDRRGDCRAVSQRLNLDAQAVLLEEAHFGSVIRLGLRLDQARADLDRLSVLSAGRACQETAGGRNQRATLHAASKISGMLAKLRSALL